MKNSIRLNESKLKEFVRQIVESALNDNNLEYPEDVIEWGNKIQELGLIGYRLCGKYRNDDELYGILSEIQSELNAACGDLNTYSISSHWDM